MLKRIKEVFTKEYRDETEYLDFMQKVMLSKLKLKNGSESIDAKIDRLREQHFHSSFVVEIGGYE